MIDVSVVIPFRDHASMTATCVRSLLRHGPAVREVLLVNNRSTPAEMAILSAELPASDDARGRIRVVDWPHPFNYQELNNWAVRQTEGETILFMNNDVELVPASEGVLERMHAHTARDDVGMVGCLLLYGDGRTIQHAGVYLRSGKLGDHLYLGRPHAEALERAGSAAYPYDLAEDRPVTAVTGAVQMIRRQDFDAVGGFDERFIVCGGDVDLCIRLNQRGLQTWYLGGGHLLHKESQSRSGQAIPYSDFCHSYTAYMAGYDLEVGDPHLPLATQAVR